MQAIVTRYLGPTNTRGIRIKATADAGSITVGYDDALNSDENHKAAAIALCNKFNAEARKRHPEAGEGYMPWPTSDLTGGALPDGAGYCFVFAAHCSGCKRPYPQLGLSGNNLCPQCVGKWLKSR